MWKDEKVDFGMPSSELELSEMFRLRYDVYVKEKGYIPGSPNIARLEEDRDEHDENNECHYFIAKCRGKIVGTARMIESETLPIEADYFDFKKPKEFNKISKERIIEIGRLISRPRILNFDDFPRHLIPLGMFLVMSYYGKEMNYYGGYGALKLNAFKKFNKIGFPLKLIKKYELKYSPQESSDPLKNFFNTNDPVVPLYFLNDDVLGFYDRLLEKSNVLEKRDENTYFIKNKISVLDILNLKFKKFFNI